MTEYWERTLISGYEKPEGKKYEIEHKEIVLHRRGADALSMAMRRNPAMPRCDRFRIHTEEAFMAIRSEEDRMTAKRDIPKDRENALEWDYGKIRIKALQ